MSSTRGREYFLQRTASVFGCAALLIAMGSSTSQAAVPTHARSTAAQIAAVVTAAPANGFDAQLLLYVNQARAAAGVSGLTAATGLNRLSVFWSGQMQNGATNYQLQHNTNAWDMVTSYGAANRTSWGENVGWSSSAATSARQMFTAYMNSPGHRANILSRSYHFIGVGTVTGAHGLFNTTEFTDAVQSGQAVRVAAPTARPTVARTPVRVPAPAVANGSFLVDVSTSAVYRIAGGAPVYVSSWAAVGGVRRTRAVSHAQLLALPRFPANGTYIHTRNTGAVYRIAGGAPLYVASWGPMGGLQRFVDVDPAAVSHSGGTGLWSHLGMYPTTPTYLMAAGAVYQIRNGVPRHVTSWSQVGGPKTVTVVHPLVIARAGTGGRYLHLK